MAKSDFDAIFEDCKDMGLLVGRGGRHGNIFRIKPPMCVNQEDVQFTVQVMEKAFKNHYERKTKETH